jgi:hypothetical protein
MMTNRTEPQDVAGACDALVDLAETATETIGYLLSRDRPMTQALGEWRERATNERQMQSLVGALAFAIVELCAEDEVQAVIARMRADLRKTVHSPHAEDAVE